MVFKLRDPGDLLALPPCFERETRHKVWTAKLPRVILAFVRELPSIDSEQEPLSQAVDRLIFRIADLVLDEHLGCGEL